MAEEGAGTPAQPTEPTEPIEPTEPTEPTEPAEPEGEGFNKKQLQQLGSLVGKIAVSHINEKVLPLIKEKGEPIQPALEPGDQDNAYQKFNEKIAEKFYGGDPMGAFRMMMDVQKKAQENLTQTQKTQTDKLLGTYSDKPYYKEIYQDMKDRAQTLVGQGYPSDAACRTAYAEAVNDFTQQNKGGEGEEGDLEMLGGGRPPKTPKKPKLPERLKAAAARDIEQGLFKNEEEWIEQLSPQVRQAHGI